MHHHQQYHHPHPHAHPPHPHQPQQQQHYPPPDMQALMMKQLSQLQTNVLELVAEIRDLRKRQDMQQVVIDELSREVRGGYGHKTEYGSN
ncbi:hypothetical protein HK104_007406, partial [Borealophlyctis nickersoniae]